MKIIIIICLLLFGATTVNAQEALRSYTAEMSRIERLTDDAQKSTDRGKALAAFFDSRTAEAEKQTATSETVPHLRKLIDYDFYGAYNFFRKVKNQTDSLMFAKNHLSKNEQALIRAFANNTVSNWKSGGQNPIHAPQRGYGLKGKWMTSTSNNTSPATTSATIAQTNNGNTELAKGNEAEKVKNYTEAFKWYMQSADKGNAEAMHKVGLYYQIGAQGMASMPNEAEAKKWFKKAADKGHKTAKTNLELLKKKNEH